MNTPPEEQPIRILHLEDSHLDAELIEQKLVNNSLPCHIERVDSRQAFEQALRGQDFDLILCDYSIPGFGGAAALTAAREQHPYLPVILISGSLSEEQAAQCLHLGATDYIIKHRLERLPAAVLRALSEAIERKKRHEAEARLRASEERFRELAEQSDDVFWFFGLSPEHVIFISPAVERLWGLPPERLYEDHSLFWAFTHPDDRPRVLSAWHQFTNGVTPAFEQEFRLVRSDQTVRWVLCTGIAIRNSNGELIRLSGIAKDVTERRRAEEHLRQQAELLDKASDAILVLALDGTITYWNRSAERLYGWTAEDALGKYAAQLLSPRNRQQCEAALQLVQEKREWIGELHQSNRSGDELIVECRFTLIQEQSATPRCIFVIASDITEKKREASRNLRTQRLESIGTLAGGVAHDLNNVFAPIVMAIEMLRMEYGEHSNLIDAIETSARRGVSMVRQLLTFAKGADGARLSVQPIHLLREIETILRRTFPSAIELRLNYDKKLSTILADPTQIHQILLNLCVNARDALPSGGTIALSAENVVVDLSYASAIPEGRPGKFVALRVSDTGSGIPPEIRDRIFDPFFSTKGPDKGTGLGLSTVLGIVRSHEGFIHVQSTVGRGTTFTIYLPVEESSQAQESSAPDRVQPVIGRGETILVVDDEPNLREVTRKALERHGFNPVTAADGIQALTTVVSLRDQLSAIVTDVRMPNLDGIMFVRAVRQVMPQIGVVVITGRKDEIEQQQFLDLGVASILEKPFSQGALLDALSQILTHPRS